MAVARWMIPNRSLRSGRPHRSRLGNDEDFYKLDPAKNPKENALHILQALCTKPQEVPTTYKASTLSFDEDTSTAKSNKISDAKRLAYLNAFVKLLSTEQMRTSIGFTTEELLCCLRVCLIHEATYVRAAALRVIRYILRIEADIIIFNNLRLPYLIARSLDVVLRNEVERAQALRVVRRALAVAPGRLAPALARCLAAAVAGGAPKPDADSPDRLVRACVATLAEIGVVNLGAWAWCGGAGALVRHAAACEQPHMAEAAAGVLLHALDGRAARRLARVDLRSLAAPYADFHDRAPLPDKNRDEREMRFTCSRLSLLCVLRSWPGLLHFCHPLHHSGLRALVDVLYLNQLEVRNAILDLLYELLGLPQPEWTDEMSVALAAVDPSDFQDSWRLNEGFVVSEGLSILPHLAATGPDITEIHMALLLYCFLESGLLDALAEVICSSDTFISVRATVLLGQLLCLAHALLPAEVAGAAPALPGLLARAAAGQHRALAAAAALQRLRALLEARPATASLFLDRAVRACAGAFAAPAARRERAPAGRAARLLGLADRRLDALVRDSNVLLTKDAFAWDWCLIGIALQQKAIRWSEYGPWWRCLVGYLRPSANQFSHADAGTHPRDATLAVLQVVPNLLPEPHPECRQLLHELFADIVSALDALLAARSAHECLFSPQHMSNTMCQMYFLIIAQLCHDTDGLQLFYETGLFDRLLKLSTTTHHNCYVKLIISSLDYTIDSYSRQIMTETLKCSIEPSRLYATQFLNVILRARQKGGEMIKRKQSAQQQYGKQRSPYNDESDSPTIVLEPQNTCSNMDGWVLDLLVKQAADESKAVSRCALSALDEACNIPAYLDHLVPLRGHIRALFSKDRGIRSEELDDSAVMDECLNGGDRAYLLWLQLASTPKAFDRREMEHELIYWESSYNTRYARLVESCAHAALTLGARGGGGAGPRAGGRSARAPPHLYALLAAGPAPQAPLLLRERGGLPAILQRMDAGACASARAAARLKGAVWAACAAAAGGAAALLGPGRPLGPRAAAERALRLLKSSPRLSVRAAALHALGLLASTDRGARLLHRMGWPSVRHTRHERFPIVREEGWQSPETLSEEEGEEEGGEGEAGAQSPPSGAGASEGGSGASESRRSPAERAPGEPAPARGAPEGRPPALRADSFDRWHEGSRRLRNNSESSTSGVSSCDSVYGKYTINDRVLTLSPIPSSSSLSVMKGVIPRRRSPDTQRRISLQSYVGSDTASSPPSQKDLAGYATLKSLGRYRRPHYSESNAKADEMNIFLTGEARRLSAGTVSSAHGAFASLREKRQQTRASLLKYDWKPLAPEASGSLPVPALDASEAAPAGARGAARAERGFRYMGVCVPRRLLDVFPDDDDDDPEERSAGDDSLSADVSAASSGRAGDSAPASDASASASGGRTARRHDVAGCLLCCRSRPASSAELREAFFAGSPPARSPPAPPASRAAPDEGAEEVLALAERMGNPVWHKPSRQALLALKQARPERFQSVCLYSDVCGLMTRNAYRVSARRFLQELFLDLDFSAFLGEPRLLLRMKAEAPD